MAKRQDETQEMPVTVETVQEKSMETVETVEIVNSDGDIDSGLRSSGSTDDVQAPRFEFVETEEMPDKAMHGQSTETFIVNEETGQMTVIYSRQGYALRPIPAGWREASEEELAGGKHG